MRSARGGARIQTSSQAEEKQYLRDGRAPLPRLTSTSRVMSSNRAGNTRPEIELRSALRRQGLPDFEENPSTVTGRPDIVFRSERVAVFVHGCFWHRCPHCKPALPKSHRVFWREKFRANRLRDARKSRQLRSEGWSVLTVWECQVLIEPERAARRVARALKSGNPGLN